MKIDSLFKEKSCVFAMEVFPPKKQSNIESVYGMLDKISEIPCDYISVTYSAGGDGAKEYTAKIASRLKEKNGIEPLAHLTCYNSSRKETELRLSELKDAGVENILALRGDRMAGIEPCKDFTYASDLVKEIKTHGDFYVVGACYPEGHPESANANEDIDALKIKLDSGAGHLVSQLFFDNSRFYRFMNIARKHNVNCPIEAGIMPIVRAEQIRRILALSSASVPPELSKIISKYEGDADSFYKAGVDYAIRQIRDLIEGGVDGIHLYAMNKPTVAKEIYDGIFDLLQQ